MDKKIVSKAILFLEKIKKKRLCTINLRKKVVYY